MTIQELFIDVLIKQQLVGGRYDRLHCVTFKLSGREGLMSFVFRANDKIMSDSITITLIDPKLVAIGVPAAQQFFIRKYRVVE